MALQGTRGRPAHDYKSKTFGTIEGLTKLSSGRWKIRSTGHRFRSTDEAKAIEYFNEKTGRSNVIVIGGAAAAEDAPHLDVRGVSDAGDVQTKQVVRRDVSQVFGAAMEERTAYLWFRQQLLDDPRRVAAMTGLPSLANWRKFDQYEEETSKLSSLWPLYKAHTEAKAPKTIAKTKKAWDRFVASVDVIRCDDVTDDLLLRYSHQISGDTTLKSKTQALEFSKVKAVVNVAAENGAKVGTLPSRLKLKLKTKTRDGEEDSLPAPMSKKTFRTLLNSTDDLKMRVLLLMGLNCAMYIAEVCDVKWKHVDLERGTLVMRRGKTKIMRAAVLWPETVAALKAWKAQKTRGEYVLTSQRGTKYNEESCRKWYGEYRDRLKMDREKDNDFNSLRDAAATASSGKVLLQQTQVLCGHKVTKNGLTDKYIARHPEYVADACRVIHEAFMA
jgi:integrase